LAGFSGLHCALETCRQRFGQFLNDLFKDLILDFRDFMLDFRKIALEIQHKTAICVGNRDFCRESATKIAKNRGHNQFHLANFIPIISIPGKHINYSIVTFIEVTGPGHTTSS